MSQTSDQNDSFAISLRKIVDNTANIAGGGGGGGGPPTGPAGGVLSGTYPNPGFATPPVTSISPLSRLSTVQQKNITRVQQPTPPAGSSITVATLTGSGICNMIQLTIEDNDSAWNDRLQVFTDGATLPDIDVDFGTLFLTHLDGHLGPPNNFTTLHMQTAPVGTGEPAGFPHPNAMSAGFFFPVPYSNGLIIKVYSPPGSTAVGVSNGFYAQIAYQNGVTSNLRLRSQCRTWLNKATYSDTDIITFFDMPNAAGNLVWHSMAVKGATNETYLERIQFFAVDGESTTPDGNGVVTTAFSTSGGEDLYLNGWYFAGMSSIYGSPWTILTASNNANFTTVAGFDFLAAYGGLKFTTQLKCGWSLKPGGYITTGHDMSWCFLYYIDTSVPFAPSAPTISASSGDTQVTLLITPPTSYGSQAITGYTGTYSPGGGTFTANAGDTSKVVTGLTNGVSYSFNLKAVNSVGSSVNSNTATSTPAAGVPTIPTISSATILSQFMANSLVANDGDLIALWTKNSGSSSISYSQSTNGNKPTYKTNLANGLPGLRFTASAPNMMAPSGSYNSAAPICVIAALKPVATTDQRVWDTNPGGGAHGRALGGINSGGTWSTYAGTGDAVGAAATSAFTVVSWFVSGASSYVAVNGVKGSTANAGSGGLDTPILGADALTTPASTFDGDLLEFIPIAGAISDSDRHLIEAYLGSKYGITIS